MMRRDRMGTFALFVLGVIALDVLAGCGSTGGGTTSVPPPLILNINNSTTPTSPVGLAIEINGSNFLNAPGQVIFTQGNITAPVTPAAGGWSSTSIVVDVPSGNGSATFTVPGTVTVTVKTAGGTSNGVMLSLVQTSTFNVNNVTWTTTTPLPTPLSGLRAVAVQASNSSAFAIAAGGFDGAVNVTTVLSNTLAPDGTLGLDWTTIATNPTSFSASAFRHGGS